VCAPVRESVCACARVRVRACVRACGAFRESVNEIDGIASMHGVLSHGRSDVTVLEVKSQTHTLFLIQTGLPWCMLFDKSIPCSYGTTKTKFSRSSSYNSDDVGNCDRGNGGCRNKCS
jgi:hypothetical protein